MSVMLLVLIILDALCACIVIGFLVMIIRDLVQARKLKKELEKKLNDRESISRNN